MCAWQCVPLPRQSSAPIALFTCVAPRNKTIERRESLHVFLHVFRPYYLRQCHCRGPWLWPCSETRIVSIVFAINPGRGGIVSIVFAITPGRGPWGAIPWFYVNTMDRSWLFRGAWTHPRDDELSCLFISMIRGINKNKHREKNIPKSKKKKQEKKRKEKKAKALLPSSKGQSAPTGTPERPVATADAPKSPPGLNQENPGFSLLLFMVLIS